MAHNDLDIEVASGEIKSILLKIDLLPCKPVVSANMTELKNGLDRDPGYQFSP